MPDISSSLLIASFATVADGGVPATSFSSVSFFSEARYLPFSDSTVYASSPRMAASEPKSFPCATTSSGVTRATTPLQSPLPAARRRAPISSMRVSSAGKSFSKPTVGSGAEPDGA